MGSSVSWGQRKALGRRYSVDPELEMEKKRMEQEYALMIPRAQLAEQRRQADMQRQAQEDAAQRSGMSGLIGAGGNIASTYMMSKALTPAAAIPSTVVGATGATPALTPASGYVMGGANASEAAFGGVNAGVMALPTEATPLATGASGITGGTSALAETGGVLAGEGGAIAPSSTGIGTGVGVGSMAMPALGGAAAGYGMTKLQDAISKNININTGKVMTLGLMGGEKENAVAGASLHGAGAGALAGLAVGGGIGAAVGAVVGGIVGAATELFDSWICTATSEEAYMIEEEKAKMSQLKIYAIKNHFGWWNSYLKHGTTLVEAIKLQEKNLPEFYGTIRLILIEPIYKEQDMEKCFQIYLAITKMLFRAYMPSFNFQEEN